MLQGEVQNTHTEIVSRANIVETNTFGNMDLIDITTSGLVTNFDDGAFIVLSSAATEGLLSVKPWNSDDWKLLPFFKGYNNRLLVKAVRQNGSNTATLAYWAK